MEGELELAWQRLFVAQCFACVERNYPEDAAALL
jgi:hypothetical protein